MTLKSINRPPVAYLRIDDNELFTLNEDGETYSLHWTKVEFPDSIHSKYYPSALSNTLGFSPIASD